MNKTRKEIDNHIGNCPRCDKPARICAFEQCESCEAVVCFRCFASGPEHLCYVCLFRNREMREVMARELAKKLRGVVPHPEQEGGKFRCVMIHEDALPILEPLGLAVIV